MSADTLQPLYSRLDPEMTARTRRRLEEAHATKTQSAIEYILFAVFGATILIAAIALVITNTSKFRHVPERIADGIAADRVNVLVLNTEHDGKVVITEGLMLFSVKPSTHEVAITSIPQDLWVKLGKFGERRLASAVEVGNSGGYPGDGLGLTADVVQNAFGQKIHGYVTLDRTDLVRAVDAVGGIDVNVQQNFLEYRHRTRFTRGRHHFDGSTAMRYAFAPQVLGPANDRFAREARQQQIVAALLGKASSNPALVAQLSGDLNDRTNIEPAHRAWLQRVVAGREPRRVTLAPYVDTFEVATFADTGEAVRPRKGDFHEMKTIIANVFTQTAITAK